MQVTPTQLRRLIAAHFASPVRQPTLLVEGMPGIGKTEIIRQAAQEALPAGFLVAPPTASVLAFEPAGAVALPAAGEDRCRRVPVGEFASVLLDSSPERPAVLFVDELGSADEDVQKSLMRWIIMTAELPAHVHVIAATNGRAHRAGSRIALAPVRTRVRTVELTPDVDAWATWALDQDHIPAALVGYLRWSGVANRDGAVSSSLCAPEVPVTDAPYPTPRGWEAAGRAESSLSLPDDLLHVAIAGDVGEGEAAAYMAFRTMYQDAVAVDAVFLAPDAAPLPRADKPALAAGLVCGAVNRVLKDPNGQNCGALATYLHRMAGEALIDYVGYAGRLLMSDATAGPALWNSKVGQKLLTDPRVTAIAYGREVE